MEFEKFLSDLKIDKSRISYLVSQILSGKLTIPNLHNKKGYSKKNDQYSKVIEYAIVFEIIKMLEKDNEK